MNLLLTSKLESIRIVFSYEKCDVATSIESARIKSRAKKYEYIIVDKSYQKALEIFTNSVSLDDYLTYQHRKNKKLEIKKQEIIAVWSVKGGVGKTTLIKKLLDTVKDDYKVLVIDMNYADGGSDLSYMLGLPVIPHLGTYLNEQTKNYEALQKNLCKYDTNIYILQAPPKLSFVQNLTFEDIERILSMSVTQFDMILFDLPNHRTEIVEKTFMSARKKVIVTTGEIPEVKRIQELNISDIILCSVGKSKLLKIYLPQVRIFSIEKPEELIKIK